MPLQIDLEHVQCTELKKIKEKKKHIPQNKQKAQINNNILIYEKLIFSFPIHFFISTFSSKMT